MSSPKMVIVVRKDLNMRKGKIAAQAAHAAVGAILKLMDTTEKLHCNIKTIMYLKNGMLAQWLDGKFTKICVYVNSEQELLEIQADANDYYINSCLIKDAGDTEFNGVPTYTCIALGPDNPEYLDKVTGDLPLY